MIILLAGDQNVYHDAPPAGAYHFAAHALIGKEIGGGDVDGFLCRGKQSLKQNTGPRGPARGRAAGDDESRDLAGAGRQGWKIVRSVENFARSLQPIFHEGSLQSSNRIALDARHGVAPTRFAFFADGPPIGIASAADKRHGTVDDGDFAMRAVVGSEPVVQA